jgi:arginine utilization protein RocB
VASGDYLSGRGVLDMKSGIAINLVLLRHFSERAGELNGNLMFLATCDEENDSRGMWSALEDLWEWKEQEGLDYIAAINSDYTAPRYEGDPHRYLYLGTVGKLLPTFFIVGRETHAGQPFSGFDPNLVAAALTKRIDYNPAFCDEMDGEVTPPPVSLKQADLKQKYDVQTPVSAYVYFNFFVFRRTPAEVLALLKEVATESFREAVSLHEERLKAYAERTGEPYRPAGIEPRVFTIEEFLNDARRRLGQELDSALEQFKEDLLRDGNMDVRDFSLRVTEELWRLAGDGEPAVILFYSSPYIPRVMPDESDERYLRLFSAVRESVAAVASHCSHPIQVRKFFPYISDMSFVALSDSDEEIAAFARNMPAWGVKYCLDADAIRRLQVPAVNIGPYGKDAHKQWERLELSYSTKIAPELTAGVIRRLIGERAYEC